MVCELQLVPMSPSLRASGDEARGTRRRSREISTNPGVEECGRGRSKNPRRESAVDAVEHHNFHVDKLSAPNDSRLDSIVKVCFKCISGWWTYC